MKRLWAKLKEIDRRLPSSSIGTFVSVLFGLLGLALVIWYQKAPQLKYEILSQSPVYSIREQIPDLEIMFKGENIRKQQQTLSVITIRVSNPGSAPITPSSFDARDLPGVSITDGKIITLDDAQRSPKLKKTLELTKIAENQYVIQPLILDKDQFFVLKLLVISPESSHPKVESIGNVAGVSNIEVTQPPSPEEKQSFISKAFSGDWFVQLVRAIAYTVAVVALVILIIVSTLKISDKLERAHRRRLARKFRTVLGHEPTRKETAILERYIKYGESTVIQLNKAFADKSSLAKDTLKYTKADRTKPPPPLDMGGVPPEFHTGHFIITPLSWLIPMLLEQKIITVENDEVTIDDQVAQTTIDFESFLLANEPERIKSAKEPLGSDVHPQADLSSATPTRNPEE